jgi:protein SCO1/2
LRDQVLHRYKRPDAPDGADGWHFLTGEQAAITALTEAVGLKYAYSEAAKSFAHPVGVVLLTPEGRIARYLYGMDFPHNDLRLALYEASQGKISSPITPILLLCYQYDVVTGRYTNVVMGLVRAAGVLTVLGLGAFLGVMFRRDLRGQKEANMVPAPGQAAAAGGKAEE